MGKNWILLGVFLLVNSCYGSSSVAPAGMCGQPKADNHKTCISVRLPWKAEPIYFCTEKENVKYEKQCPESHKCPQTQWSNITLLVATPWDCCPIASKPSHCENVACAPKPLNRTCVTLKKRYLAGCCPTYFCEESSDPEETCNFKALEPSCHSPPKHKKKCIGFVDHHGCCTKYQCEGEGKPGTCPAHHAVLPPGGVSASRAVHQTTRVDKIKKMVDATPAISDMFRKPQKHHRFHQYMQPIHCIGDWNCPGDMKCCPSSYGSGYDGHGWNQNRYGAGASYYPTTPAHETDPEDDSNSIFYDSRAVYGFCAHPVAHTKTSGPNKRITSPSPAEVEAE